MASRAVRAGGKIGPAPALRWAVALSAFVGCAGDAIPEGSPDGSWRSDTTTVRDTMVVRTLSGSVHGSGRLVEELRIGRVEGEAHEIFGQIGGLGVAPNGDVLVHDAQAGALRRYDAAGDYLGTIGGRGAGPGEYENVSGLGVMPDGRIVLNDFGNGRFNLYSPGGDYLEAWSLRPAIATRRPLHPHPGGGVLLHTARVDQAAGRLEEVLARVGNDGVPRDTIPLPHADYRAAGLSLVIDDSSVGVVLPFTPVRSWSVTPDGELVAMLGDRYAVDIHWEGGSVLRIARLVEPVEVSAEEREAEEARIRAFFERFVDHWSWDGPPLPRTRPPISWVHAGRDGTIWVRVAQPGEVIPEVERAPNARTHVREPIVFDLFDGEGQFLGRVDPPDGFRIEPHPVFDRDRVWAVVADELGVEFVARFRIEWGRNGG